jgi:pimeloyl-ACP methyl ester carboxylesterase
MMARPDVPGMDSLEKPKLRLLDEHHGMAYACVGRGPTLLFIHGSLCDYRYWIPQISGLCDHFKIVAPSLGHYFPRLPSADRRPFCWQAHVEQLAQFIHKQAEGPVKLVGHSRGASIAWQLLIRHPSLVSSIALIDPAGHQGNLDIAAAGLRSQREMAAKLIQQGDREQGLRLFVESVSKPGYWDRADRRFKQMARDNADTLPLQLRDPLPAYDPHDASAVRVAVLLMQGQNSPELYKQNSSNLRMWLPQHHDITIPNASHGMTMTHPRNCNSALYEHFKS